MYALSSSSAASRILVETVCVVASSSRRSATESPPSLRPRTLEDCFHRLFRRLLRREARPVPIAALQVGPRVLQISTRLVHPIGTPLHALFLDIKTTRSFSRRSGACAICAEWQPVRDGRAVAEGLCTASPVALVVRHAALHKTSEILLDFTLTPISPRACAPPGTRRRGVPAHAWPYRRAPTWRSPGAICLPAVPLT